MADNYGWPQYPYQPIGGTYQSPTSLWNQNNPFGPGTYQMGPNGQPVPQQQPAPPANPQAPQKGGNPYGGVAGGIYTNQGQPFPQQGGGYPAPAQQGQWGPQWPGSIQAPVFDWSGLPNYQGPGWNFSNWQGMSQEDVARAGQFNQAQLEWTNLAANMQQSGRDFDEYVRQYGLDRNDKNVQDAWARGMAEQQQKAQEYQFGTTENRLYQTMEGQLAAQNRDIARQEQYGGRELDLRASDQDRLWNQFSGQLGLDTTRESNRVGEAAQRFGLDDRAQNELTAWRNRDLDVQTRGQDKQLEGQAVNAWGRRYRGNVRFQG